MARVICIANQKGGVGKTTTTVNLAAALGQLGRRVLIVDMDPQGNASSGIGIKRYESQDGTVYHVLVGEKQIGEVMHKTTSQNLEVVTANPDLVGAEIELVDMEQREYRLKAAIQSVAENYHYVIIDCPPSLGLLTVNALCAADSFLVPLQCEYYALEGLSQLLNTAGIIKKNLNPNLRIEGIVLTMFDARNNLSHQVVSEIQSHFGDKVFSAIIPRNVRLSEAPSHGQSIMSYDPKSIGAKKYQELAIELDQRVYGRVATAETNVTTTEAPVNSPAVETVEQPIEQVAKSNGQSNEPAAEQVAAPVAEVAQETIVEEPAAAVEMSTAPEVEAPQMTQPVAPAMEVTMSSAPTSSPAPVAQPREIDIDNINIDDLTELELEQLTAPTPTAPSQGDAHV